MSTQKKRIYAKIVRGIPGRKIRTNGLRNKKINIDVPYPPVDVNLGANAPGDGSIPDAIDNHEFCGCKHLTEAVIADGMVGVGICAFMDCVNLVKVTIPKSVIKIDCFAFCNCKKLSEIAYSGTVSDWENIEKCASWDLDTGRYSVFCAGGAIIKRKT